MNHENAKRQIALTRLLLAVAVMTLVAAATAYAAVPGISGTTFSLTAQAAYVSMPDGASIYSWGYGCASTYTPTFAPNVFNLPPAGATTGKIGFCSQMQVPGPTLIVTEGQSITVTLTNNLPAAAGNTSILFPGFAVTATGSGIVDGLLTKEVPPGGAITYSFTATSPGTRSYYSGTKGDLQIEMGLYGAIIVLPNTVPSGCRAVGATLPDGQPDYRLAASGYDHSSTCYDREYLFQFSELDPEIHRQAALQSTKICAAGTVSGCMDVVTEPYIPAYYLINGRSMPDDMDPAYAPQYPYQPYNGNPHIHPGEVMLVRMIGQGREQHPFHEHAEHLRLLARDGNLILAQNDATKLAGPLLFTTTSTPGQAMDTLFYWTGKGLNWDVYGHQPGDGSTCIPDANGYYTSNPAAPNYYEWCADHNKPMEKHPFGSVGSGGPVTLPDTNILTNGAWFGGSAYLGASATTRAVGATGTTPPSGTVANPPASEAGFGYMWHSHNEREITTNNIFPGGMMMILLIDDHTFVIDETL
jgi:FtsP/CotA-like multicopper oxidase with cupredoxin domain